MADHTPTLRLYNTLGRQLQEFVPRRPGAVRLYACGPTVYQDATIGNFRTYIFVDVLRRTLGALGYDVRHVLNVTDVGHLASDADLGDDKMLLSSRREGKTVWEIAELYTERFFADTRALNLLRPHVIARATDHIDQMIEQIRRLEAGGYTYVANGNVFFDVSRFPRYGELALLDRQQLQAGARISVDQSKRNPEDFGLWFTRSKFEGQAMLWDSPWGRGYPGWHIECSAMSMLYLDQQFDIHCGGIDLIPVHHTNEIAQAEAALGIDPQSAQRWVNYWCHGEFLMVNGAKMSKSKGNWFTLGQLVEGGYAALDFRYFVLGAHYRAHQNFTMQALDAARASRLGLIERVAALLRRAGVEDAAALSPAADGARGGGHEGAQPCGCQPCPAMPGHADAGHADASHADASHADASHAGAGHADASHADASHADASHADARPCGCQPCGCQPCGCQPCRCRPCGCQPCGCQPCRCQPCRCRPCGCQPCGCQPCRCQP